MRIRLLGPVDVMVDGEPRVVSGLRRKAVLATLALHGGEVVSVSRLVDAVWGETAPSTVRNTLQSHVSYLRTLLGDKNAIVGRPPGSRPAVGRRSSTPRRLRLENPRPADSARHSAVLSRPSPE